MATPVVDLSSNRPENIEHAAHVIGRSSKRRAVFEAIYYHKKLRKTVKEIAGITGLSAKEVVEAGKKLADNHIVNQSRVNKETVYEKIPFFQSHKMKILGLVGSPAKLRTFPTKRNPKSSGGALHVRLTIPRSKVSARLITIDDIDEFAEVRKTKNVQSYLKTPESKFKRGVARILGELGDFKDWGGESRDLSSTRVRINGKRYSTAFAFKGPGTKGKLTPGKMGKNGDQIQRLLKCPAEIFLIQYWGEIDDAVFDQLEQVAKVRSYQEGKVIRYGIIDGIDSVRLQQSYPTKFS